MNQTYPGVKVGKALAKALTLALSCLTVWTSAPSAFAQIATDTAAARNSIEAEDSKPHLFDLGFWRPHYDAGRGLHFGDSGLILGGYTSVGLLHDEGRPSEIKVDDLSLFIMMRASDRLSFFSELEFEDLATVDTNGRAGHPNERFQAERLYGDFSFSDQLEVRVGRFLTPVGRWNVIHAQPLVWTTSRPVVTEVPFDKNTTGVMFSGNLLDGRLSYDLFGQFTDKLQPAPTGVQATRAGGARLALETMPGLSIGGTYLAFRSAGEWFHLTGIDALWRNGPIEWMTELTFDEGAGPSGSQWGAYSQLVGEILPKVFAVLRYEHFAPRGAGGPLNQVVLGGAFRPRPYAVFKLEYQILDHRSELTEAGFRSSVALLF